MLEQAQADAFVDELNQLMKKYNVRLEADSAYHTYNICDIVIDGAPNTPSQYSAKRRQGAPLVESGAHPVYTLDSKT